MMRPLADIRILAIEQYGAGPFGSVHLADLGAEVVKIEEPSAGGDVSRYVPPFADGGDSLFFEVFNRNKRSISLNLRSPAGREVFEALVRVSDVVYSNLRGDVPDDLRIRYEDLKHLNPAIVCVSLTGFGIEGARKTQPGYDYILQAMAGWMSLTGEPDAPPAKSGLSLVDYTGGYVAALATLAGVHQAKRDGLGMDCDVSLFDVAVTMLTYPAIWYLNRGMTVGRLARSAHPSLVPFQAFRANDGWLIVACAKEKFFRKLAEAIDRQDLAEDPRFDSFASRLENKNALIEELDKVFITQTRDYWVDTLERYGVPCGPVRDVPAALDDPLIAERGLIAETDHPRFGRIRQLVSPVRVGDAEQKHRRGPRLNEDLEYVLHDVLGMSKDESRSFKSRGAFGYSTEDGTISS